MCYQFGEIKIYIMAVWAVNWKHRKYSDVNNFIDPLLLIAIENIAVCFDLWSHPDQGACERENLGAGVFR
jgi:hypothetical protein